MHAGALLFCTVSVKVFVPELLQLKLCGPCVVGLPPAQPSQFQVYVAPAEATPVYVAKLAALAVEALVQTSAAVKVAVGVG